MTGDAHTNEWGCPYCTFGRYKNGQGLFFVCTHRAAHRWKALGLRIPTMRHSRAAELIQTTSYGTHIAAAVCEICAVLILVYCINQIHIHCNIYEFV